MFNIFKKKNNEDSPAHEEWVKAKEFFDKSDYSSSLSTLVSGFKKDIYHKPLYELASICLGKMGGNDESVLFKKAIPKLNGNTFKELGNHFYNMEHYPLTRIFLEESFKTNKDVEVANNLSIAYARRFDIKQAKVTLESVKDKFDFWTFWFYVKMKILSNDTDGLDQQIRELEGAFDPNSTDDNIKIPKQKVRELRESFNRLQSVINPEDKIRDWHFIQYGSMILDFFYDDNQYVAGGRHVASWGNNEAIKSILKKLSSILKSKEITKIVYANTKDSKVLGITLSQISDIPAEVYNANNIYSNSLMLVGNSTEFNEFNNVESITNNNITFSFNHNWLQANFICPDVIGLMSQSYTYPWNGGNFKMNDDGTTSRTEPDSRDEEIIANEIAKCEMKDEKMIDGFYSKVETELKMNQESGHRYNFMVESPIPGSYFGTN